MASYTERKLHRTTFLKEPYNTVFIPYYAVISAYHWTC